MIAAGPVHLLFTGGTISMQYDADAGGNVPTHGGEALVGLARGVLQTIAPYRIDNWAKVPACHLGADRLWALRERVREVAESGTASGIVVAQGTDIIEESAYLLARTLDTAVPIVVTGAMRTAGEPDWDGARNLVDAMRTAADPASIGRSAQVVFAGKIFAAHEAVKMHTVALDAFGAPHGTAAGWIDGDRVRYDAERPRVRAMCPKGLSARVALISMTIGDEGTILDLVRPAHDGVVVVAFGSGNLPPGAVPAVGRWLDEGKPVVLASRCPFGAVTPVYAFEGGGARLARMGVIPAGPRTASQARMELSIAMSAGSGYGDGT